MKEKCSGRIHSVQSMGTLDGPGVRFVVFFQGCMLRCGCCHNPDTWDIAGGKSVGAGELVEMAQRVRGYFGKKGGITLSGGEPLLQPEFAEAIFSLCREAGIHTCLDTSGCLLNDRIEALLACTDRVLLDIKYTEEAQYRAYVGCSMEAPLTFLEALDRRQIPTTLRQVIIPGLNDTQENIFALRRLAQSRSCVDGVELLPFRRICSHKYDEMGLRFPFGDYPTPDKACMDRLRALLRE